MRRVLPTSLLVAAAIAAAPAAPALAADYTIDVAAQSQPVVGQPLTIQSTGTIPPDGRSFPHGFNLVALPTTVTTTCPPDRYEAMQFANANGGAVLVYLQTLTWDAAGHWEVPAVVTPSSPGSWLLCGYVDDYAVTTLAVASLRLDITAAPSHHRATHRVRPPAYARQGVRSCRALLAGRDARSCIHDIVHKANRACRRLPSRHARTHCLRAVRRAARSHA